MSEWAPQIVRLNNIERHPSADTLEMATVLGGYTVIFKEGQYKNGDLISYIPVDSICSDHPAFDWLGDKKRIKAVRLRGIFSMGITAPAPPGMNEGDSIVEYYGLKKRQEEEDEEEKKTSSENEGSPSGMVFHKYDLSALRKYGRLLELGEEVVIHEKLHGCNAMYWHDGSRLWCKSHYSFKKESETNQWWIAARQNELASKLDKHPEYAYFCELYGKQKSFRYDCPLDKQHAIIPQIRFFDVLDVKSGSFLDWDKAAALIAEAGLKAVPEIFRGAWKGQEHWALAEGNSLIGSHMREGIVVRPVKERVDPKYGRIALKHKSEAFLLKHG